MASTPDDTTPATNGENPFGGTNGVPGATGDAAGGMDNGMDDETTDDAADLGEGVEQTDAGTTSGA